MRSWVFETHTHVTHANRWKCGLYLCQHAFQIVLLNISCNVPKTTEHACLCMYHVCTYSGHVFISICVNMNMHTPANKEQTHRYMRTRRISMFINTRTNTHITNTDMNTNANTHTIMNTKIKIQTIRSTFANGNTNRNTNRSRNITINIGASLNMNTHT